MLWWYFYHAVMIFILWWHDIINDGHPWVQMHKEVQWQWYHDDMTLWYGIAHNSQINCVVWSDCWVGQQQLDDNGWCDVWRLHVALWHSVWCLPQYQMRSLLLQACVTCCLLCMTLEKYCSSWCKSIKNRSMWKRWMCQTQVLRMGQDICVTHQSQLFKGV